MINSHVILLGYMGCGKSTIASKLSSIIDIPFIDLDKYIEKEYGMTISEIFHSMGEIKFRNIEKNTLEKLLNQKEKTIFSLGGGTPCYYDNMKHLFERIIFYNKSNHTIKDDDYSVEKICNLILKKLI
jgi:shikimate kinase